MWDSATGLVLTDVPKTGPPFKTVGAVTWSQNVAVVKVWVPSTLCSEKPPSLCSIVCAADCTAPFSQQSPAVMYSTELIFQRLVH